MTPVRLTSALTASVIAAMMLAGCATSHDATPSQQPTTSAPQTTKPAAVSAHDLLLPNDAQTATGPATLTPPGDTYFTRAEPQQCEAAVLLTGSPLAPADSTDHAEATYLIGATERYSESVDVYGKDLDPQAVVNAGFTAVSGCTGEATGESSDGHPTSMRVNQVAIAADGVLEWAMISPDWNCNYALAALPRATLLLSSCDTEPDLPMADWAATRRKQMQSKLG